MNEMTDASGTSSISVASDTWNPAQYERFRDERRLPFSELLALVRPAPAMRVVDLGCGTGELTRVLHRHLGASETLGIDSSAAMLAQAQRQAGEGLRFERRDIRAFAGLDGDGGGDGDGAGGGTLTGGDDTFDLVFSNAALQWIDDHPALLERLVARLRPGGQLAVQVPANGDHPSHVVAAEVAGEAPFRAALRGHVRHFPILTPEAYATLLERLGLHEQHVRLQVFGHRLASRDDVIEWVKGTLLTDYEKRLPADLYAAFLARYRERLLPCLDDTRPYFYPFKRILFCGKKGL